MDFLDNLASEGKLDSAQVSRIRRNTYEFMKTAHDNPNFHREALMKLSGVGKTVKSFSKSVGKRLENAAPDLVAQMLASAAIVGGAAAGTGIYKALRDPVERRSSFKNMINMAPKLKAQDPEMVRAAFNTLHRFNPGYAKDPLVAGTFVQNALDWERIDMTQVNALVKADSDMKKKDKAKGTGLFQHMGRLPIESPEQRELTSAKLQKDQWSREDRPMEVQQALSRLSKMQNEEETSEHRLVAEKEMAAGNDARREAFEDMADMMSEARTNKDYEAMLEAMRRNR